MLLQSQWKLLLGLAYVLSTLEFALAQGVDPATGRCAWTSPSTNLLLPCPASFPNCSQYDGVCYRLSGGAIEACRFPFVTWGGVPLLCPDTSPENPLPPKPTEGAPAEPVSLPTSQLPTAINEPNLHCASSLQYSRYEYNGGDMGKLLSTTKLEGAAISVENNANLSYDVVTCDNFVAVTDGAYRFRVQANGGTRIVIDGQRIYDDWEKPANLIQPYTFDLELPRGSHTFEVMYAPGASTLLFVDWQRIATYDCPGFDAQTPQQTTPWTVPVLVRRYNMLGDPPVLGSLLDETRRPTMLVKDMSGTYRSLAEEYEGVVTVPKQGSYKASLVNSGFVEIYVNGVRTPFGNAEQQNGLPLFYSQAIDLFAGANLIKVVYKPRNQCAYLSFTLDPTPLPVEQAQAQCLVAGGGNQACLSALGLLGVALLLAFRKRKVPQQPQ